MVLGALLDLGLPIEALRSALGSLAIDHGTISAARVLRAGVSATKFRLAEPPDAFGDAGPAHAHSHVHAHAHAHGEETEAARRAEPARESHHHDESLGRDPDSHHHQGDGHPHRHAPGHGHHTLEEIRRRIDQSALSADGKARAVHLFERLAAAEAAIHDMPVERIHLHEVGALDSIVDVVGAVFGLEWLGASSIVSSPVNVGSGTVTCAHGVFPVPAPATARLLEGVPIYAGGVSTELTTPTGALLLTGYAERFGALPAMRVSAIGYGAGDKDFAAHPNVLRLFVGDADAAGTTDRVVTIECEIDDMNPQLFGPLMDRLFAAGALDVYYAAVQMKKSRPGTLVTVIAPPDLRDALAGLLFTETTTIGVRYQEMARETLDRQVRAIDTPLGAVRFKIASRGGHVVNAAPEFDDCARIAAERGLPIKDVQAVATRAWLESAR